MSKLFRINQPVWLIRSIVMLIAFALVCAIIIIPLQYRATVFPFLRRMPHTRTVVISSFRFGSISTHQLAKQLYDRYANAQSNDSGTVDDLVRVWEFDSRDNNALVAINDLFANQAPAHHIFIGELLQDPISTIATQHPQHTFAWLRDHFSPVVLTPSVPTTATTTTNTAANVEQLSINTTHLFYLNGYFASIVNDYYHQTDDSSPIRQFNEQSTATIDDSVSPNPSVLLAVIDDTLLPIEIEALELGIKTVNVHTVLNIENIAGTAIKNRIQDMFIDYQASGVGALVLCCSPDPTVLSVAKRLRIPVVMMYSGVELRRPVVATIGINWTVPLLNVISQTSGGVKHNLADRHITSNDEVIDINIERRFARRIPHQHQQLLQAYRQIVDGEVFFPSNWQVK